MTADQKPSGIPANPLVCEACGTKIPMHAPSQENGRRVCEPCFLHGLGAEVGSAPQALHADFAEALVEALDLREHETGQHSRRVACHTLVLARRFWDDPEMLRQVYWGALLHDLGKIGVPDHILLKAGPLDEEEWSQMQRHTEDGYHIVRCLPGMEHAAELVRCHEERFDGSGYPRRLRGDEIPLSARLFSVIDTLDAISSDRPYRKAQSFDLARTEIARMSGTQFDPLAVDAMLAEETVLRHMVAMKCAQLSSV